MTTKELHIGIDVALKLYNSSMLGRLLPEEKDYILNKAIVNLVHKTAEDARHSIVNTESYADITAFYNVLEPFLITKTLLDPTNRGRYNEYNLPRYLSVIGSSGDEIIAGIRYKVEEVGNINTITNMDLYPDVTYIEDDLLYLEPSIEIYYDNSGVDEFRIYQDIRYEIIRSDGIDFTEYGAPNNDVGTIFIASQNHNWSLVSSNNGETKLRILGHVPSTWSNVKLVALKNLDFFDHIAVNTLISTNKLVSESNGIRLQKGTYYKVRVAGEFDDLINFGSEWNNVEKDYIFVATNNGIPTWSTDSTAILEILTNSPCRLVKPHDIASMLEHSYGSTASSPLATFGDGKVQIYHDNKYSIAKAEIIYVRPPVTVDSVAGTEPDLNPNLHPQIVTLAVQDIVSTNNPQLYQTVMAQIAQQQQPK